MSGTAENLEQTTETEVTEQTEKATEATEKSTETKTEGNVTWPEQWREQLAGGDEKLLKQLHQFTDPGGVYKSYRALQQKMSSGEFKKGLPEKPTEEDLAQYRKDMGIPDSPDKYDIKPEGVWEDESNKERFDALLKFAHENNYTPAQTRALFSHVAKGHQSAMDDLAERDEASRIEAEETLRADLGSDYKISMNLVSGMFDGEPEGTKDEFLDARLSDGTKLRNNPDMVKMLVRFAREINPVGAIMPSGSTDAKSIDDELNSLKELYVKDNKKYNSKQVQDRLAVLYAAKEKLGSR